MTGSSALEAAIRRDRIVVLTAALALSAAAFLFTYRLGVVIDGDRMARMFGPLSERWGVADIILVWFMWAAMMIGMMTPSAAPMVLLYARVGRSADPVTHPFASAGWFYAGYLAAWCGFAVLATAGQYGLEAARLLSSMMTSTSAMLGGTLLVVAGLYQWTPFKASCLAQCQSPLLFVQRHGGFRRDTRGALRLGLMHGAYCIGCCWSLMLLLFAAGVMNPLWIAGLAVFALVEKATPTPRAVSRVAGIFLVAAGAWMIVQAGV